jgi:hypothetical protein
MNFIDILKTSRNEKDVENNYREYFNTQLNKLAKVKDHNIGKIISPYKTDGYLKYKNKKKDVNINCLFEFKYNIDLNNKIERSRVIIQSLYYLKKFELSGEFSLPTTIFIGDINECFVIPTNSVVKYLDYNIDWNIAPSRSGYENDNLLKEIIQNDDLNNVYIIDIDENFKAMEVLKIINKISKENKSFFRISVHSISLAFDGFTKKVLDDKSLSVNDSVNLFIHTLVDRVNNYQHPNKPNVLMTKGFGEVKINGSKYKSYINFFNTELSPKEKEIITATQDRLIEDETRRRSGEFFTPTIWVDEAHKMVSETFGEDWKEKYVVWDCASGTGNLTRDYKFKELYCSTLLGSDIETMNQAGYNPESVKFQYDFLNDGIIDSEIDVENDPKLPQGLKDAIIGGKEIIFFINPPYGTSSEMKLGKSKKGIGFTEINKMMIDEKLDRSASQLFAQFLFKIQKISEKYKSKNHIALFSNPVFLTGQVFQKFRENFQNYNFVDGFLINSSEFADVKEWGLIFSILKNEKNVNENKFKFSVLKNNFNNIEKVKDKLIYNLDNKEPLNKWFKKSMKNKKTYDNVQLSSGLSVKPKGYGKLTSDAFGYLVCSQNTPRANGQGQLFLSSCFSSKNGISIFKENFINSTLFFTVRRCVKGDWMNWYDEYMAPTEEIQQTSQYKQFNNDAIVYSLFESKSQQSSMRQVEYKDKLWDIKNEFFWMDKNEILELANEHNFDELYKDVRMSENRYVYNLLKSTNLSPDAEELLEMSKELIRKSFEWRKIMHQSNTEYHLHAWDAGWYQIKKILNEHFKDDYKVFVEKYKKFEDRLRPQVYELGFLKSDEITFDVKVEPER